MIYDDTNEKLLTMAAPEDRPEIAKLADDITVPTALLTQVTDSPHVESIESAVVALCSMQTLAPCRLQDRSLLTL